MRLVSTRTYFLLAKVQKFYCKMTTIVGLCSFFQKHPQRTVLCLAAAIDFWALGICFYQFLVGVTPFTDDCPHAIISNIVNYRLQWPETDGESEQLCDDAVNAIKGLLNYDPTSRYQLNGTRESSVLTQKSASSRSLELKQEAFFQTIDWEHLPNTPAPFIPVPDNDSDTFYFEGRLRLSIRERFLSALIPFSSKQSHWLRRRFSGLCRFLTLDSRSGRNTVEPSLFDLITLRCIRGAIPVVNSIVL